MRNVTELLAGLAVLLVLAVLGNPTHILMPETVNTMLILGLVLGFLVFLGLVWQERASDERESLHIQKSGRLSFFVGTTIMVLGIVEQAGHHSVDAWLLYALFGMILAKILSRIFHHYRN